MTAAKRQKIAYQGEPGANSHLACRDAYPKMEPLACPTFEDALAAVKGGEARLAMIPIENSVAGRVADIHHLLPDSGIRWWMSATRPATEFSIGIMASPHSPPATAAKASSKVAQGTASLSAYAS